MSGSKRLFRLVLLALTMPLAVAKAAVLDIAVEGDVVHVVRGEAHIVNATITNLDTKAVFINGITSGVTPDYATTSMFDSFVATKPEALGPGESWEGPLLNLTIDANAPLGPNVFDLTLTGGAHPYANDVLSVSYFAIAAAAASAGVPPSPPASDALRASPNPFRTALGIDFVAPIAGRYEVGVFDVSGRRVAQLLSSELSAGPHHVAWNGQPSTGSASGVFFVRVAHADRVLKTKVLRLE